MEIQEIQVRIGKSGEVIIHVQGVEGPSCLQLTAALVAALGGESAVIKRVKNPEFDIDQFQASIDELDQDLLGSLE